MKQERIYKKYFQEKKAFVLMICLLILAATTVSGTIAYLIEESGSVNNDFTYGEVSCRVTEDFDGNVKENAAIRNTGNTPAYIRARVNVSWKDGQGRVYGEPVSTSVYTMQFNTADWMEKDGFFYCRKPIGAGETTPVLIQRCALTQQAEAPESGYSLSVEILADAVQSSPSHAVSQAWAVTAGADGMLQAS